MIIIWSLLLVRANRLRRLFLSVIRLTVGSTSEPLSSGIDVSQDNVFSELKNFWTLKSYTKNSYICSCRKENFSSGTGMNLICLLKHFFEYIGKHSYFIEIHKLSNLKQADMRELQYYNSLQSILSAYLLSHRGKLSYGTNPRLHWQRYAARLGDVVTATRGGERGEKHFQQAIPSNCEISHREAQI